MNLSDISYPVYKLRDEKPITTDGIVHYIFSGYKEEEDGEVIEKVTLRVVDDTTIQGSTLALRRLRLKQLGIPLLKINRAVFFLGDLIKLSKPNTWFIDSVGKTFQYKKSTRANLRFHKVKKLFPISGGGVIVEVEGIHSRMKALFAPNIPRDLLYAGVIHLGMSPILYGFYDQKHSDTWRLV